ncbi:MAG: MogA/MoaB family molybdenum cofactor biosynthesis protein [Candidatus Binataceae bacterium]
MPAHEHHRDDRKGLRIAVVTLSDTRTIDTDESGRLIRELAEHAGHRVVHYEIAADSPEEISGAIERALAQAADAVVLNGGTGIAPRDSTIEVVRHMLDQELEGFGELFRMLSYSEIGPAAFLSRALAGVARGKIIAALPGSPAACRLGMEKLLIPELGHMANLLGL